MNDGDEVSDKRKCRSVILIIIIIKAIGTVMKRECNGSVIVIMIIIVTLLQAS